MCVVGSCGVFLGLSIEEIQKREIHIRTLMKTSYIGFDKQIREGMKNVRGSPIGNKVFGNDLIFQQIMKDGDYASFLYDQTVCDDYDSLLYDLICVCTMNYSVFKCVMTVFLSV